MASSWPSRLRGVGPLLIAVLLVLSGCTAPGVAPDQPSSECSDVSQVVTATETQVPSAVEQHSLDPWGINASQTFERVECLLDTDGEQPYVSVSADRIQDFDWGGGDSQPFFAAFGLDAAQTGDVTPTAFVNSPATVVIDPNISATTAEAVLAHEFVHTMQRQNVGSWSPSFENTSLYREYGATPYSLERRTMHRTLREGSAEYVYSAYVDQYIEANDYPATSEAYRQTLQSRYHNSTGYEQYQLAPYYHGLTYLEGRINDSASITDVFDSSPLTSEQLLHRETPASEPRLPLTVTVGGNESLERVGGYANRGSAGEYVNRGPVGELVTRVLLDQELDRERAVEAAAGWGNDTLVNVDRNETAGLVWITRWDTVEDTDQFEAAIENVGAQRPHSIELANRSVPSEITTDRPAEDVVAVYIGPDSLATTHPVDADGRNVTIDPRR